MANRERGELAWVVGGHPYTLRLTTNSACELEDFSGGRTADHVIEGVNAGSYRDVRLLLWMALRDHHPDVATTDLSCLEAIGRLIDRSGGRPSAVATLRTLVLLNSEPSPGGVPRPLPAQPVRRGVNSTLRH